MSVAVMRCPNCDSDRNLGFRRMCLTHAHEVGEALLKALKEIMESPMSIAAIHAAHAAITKAESK